MPELTPHLGAQIQLPSELVKPVIFPHEETIVVKDLPTQVILATTTLYQDLSNPSHKLRADLAYQMMQKATQRGYQVIVNDDQSNQEWRNKIKEMNGVILIDRNIADYNGEHNLGRSRRQCLDFAANYGRHKVIVWLEPEKHTFIWNDQLKRSPLSQFSSVVYDERASIAIPQRKDNLEGYPLQQQLAELTGNMTLFDLIRDYVSKKSGIEAANNIPYLDYWIGPRAISKDSIDAFLQYNGRVNGQKHDRWESIFNPIISEILAGKVVRGVAVDYQHPLEQSRLEAADLSFSRKRLDQLVTIVAGVDNLLKEHQQKGLKITIAPFH